MERSTPQKVKAIPLETTGNELVSIIVTAYNSEKWLPKLFASIVAQTYRPLECIIINDGSTDSTASVCLHYQKQYLSDSSLKFRYYFQKNAGVGAALLAGFRLVRGAFFCWSDSDDYFEPDYVRLMREEMNTMGRNVIVPNVFLVKNNGEKKQRFTLDQIDDINQITDMFSAFLFSKINILAPDPFIRTSFYRKICPTMSFVPVRFSYDGQFYSQIYSVSRVYFYKTPLANISLRSDSVSHKENYTDISVSSEYLKAKIESVELLVMDEQQKKECKDLICLSTFYRMYLVSCSQRKKQLAIYYFKAYQAEKKICISYIHKRKIKLSIFKATLFLSFPERLVFFWRKLKGCFSKTNNV